MLNRITEAEIIMSSPAIAKQVLAAVIWSQTNEYNWVREDGAAVKYREQDNYMYSKPWTGGHRGWVAYSPTEEYPLSYKTKRGFNVAIKYKSAKNAMSKIDRLFPNSL